MSGSVVAFHSLGGSVREPALSWTAGLLCSWGHRVLCVDWSMQPHGLSRYLRPVPGLAELLLDQAGTDAVTPIRAQGRGRLYLIATGLPDGRATAVLRGLDWAARYHDDGWGDLVERHRARWVSDYDFVLVDTPAGTADPVGVCLAQLPDRVVTVVVPETTGPTLELLRLTEDRRDALPYDRARLQVLPVPYLQGLDARALPLFDAWADRRSPRVRADLARSDGGLSLSTDVLTTVAALVAHGFADTRTLARDRRSYVAGARHPHEAGLVLVCSPADAPFAARLALRLVGVDCVVAVVGGRLPAGVVPPDRHVCLVLGADDIGAVRAFGRAFDHLGDLRLFAVLVPGSPDRPVPGATVFRIDDGAAVDALAGRLRDGIRPVVRARSLVDRAAEALDDVLAERLSETDWAAVSGLVVRLRSAAARHDGRAVARVLDELGPPRPVGDLPAPDDLVREVPRLLDRLRSSPVGQEAGDLQGGRVGRA
ncbi:hypothetical protein GCM10022243_02350 [Saccharothrix violaceirubra]|uniref:Uncharacterized protein n=1 Tax=Saccharothrix violaceirubra TaxID=413306 RepID=A0A7W7T3M5_9PSEU|nr:hypothetical protein [Saccharothrix violaceirubra]MBB4965992.1 hypothetical protein [Saccharothrix violaceirubra]